MQINMDFAQRVVVSPKQHQWVSSPTPGVNRVMLDRDGLESGRATSLVRYAPNTTFPLHVHSGGEEILVLEGEFSDEKGLYPAGTYVRNPIGSQHRPTSGPNGALLFVKLCQFDANDSSCFALNTRDAAWHQGLVPGLRVQGLHQFGTEHAALVRWAPNTNFSSHRHWGGEEILVLEGTFYDEHGVYPKGTWIRSPHLSAHQPYTKDDGALIYVKTGHLMGVPSN